jgi:hypothetical protein
MPGLRSSPLATPIDAQRVEAEVREHAFARVDLPEPAVDEDQVGRLALAVGELAVARSSTWRMAP